MLGAARARPTGIDESIAAILTTILETEELALEERSVAGGAAPAGLLEPFASRSRQREPRPGPEAASNGSAA